MKTTIISALLLITLSATASASVDTSKPIWDTYVPVETDINTPPPIPEEEQGDRNKGVGDY